LTLESNVAPPLSYHPSVPASSTAEADDSNPYMLVVEVNCEFQADMFSLTIFVPEIVRVCPVLTVPLTLVIVGVAAKTKSGKNKNIASRKINFGSFLKILDKVLIKMCLLLLVLGLESSVSESSVSDMSNEAVAELGKKLFKAIKT
jgi:hypothetical protein